MHVELICYLDLLHSIYTISDFLNQGLLVLMRPSVCI